MTETRGRRFALALGVFVVAITVLRFAGLYQLELWRVVLIAYTFFVTFEVGRRIWEK